ncbi:hypothetical protein ACS0TY_021983 [Phlomoides rotata]
MEVSISYDEILEEADKAWDVGRRLGLHSKYSYEEIWEHLDKLERKDKVKEKNAIQAFRESDGRSGSILNIWNNFILVRLIWDEMHYYQCVRTLFFARERKSMGFDQTVFEQNADVCIYVVGDFNLIRSSHERVGISEITNNRDIRLFTKYRPDGTCKSKLDTILVNEEWTRKWPNQVLKGLGRTLSDHCPIYLKNLQRDWGHKTFKSFNDWLTPGVESFIINNQQEARRSEMGSWGNGGCEWSLNGTRSLRDMEISYVNDLIHLVNRVKLKQHEEDKWRWIIFLQTASSQQGKHTRTLWRQQQSKKMMANNKHSNYCGAAQRRE